jgi:uncharacterized membrane protein
MSDLNNWHIIAAMSIVTIGIRWAGFFIMEHVPLTPFVKRFLQALPGVILVSTVVPVCIKTGWVAIAGLFVAILIMVLTKRDFIALFFGLLTISLLRLYSY